MAMWRHRRGWRRAVPMLLAGRNPDHVARPDLLYRPAPALCTAAARRHDQRLPQRVRMPGRAGARLERDPYARTRAGSGACNSGSMRTAPVKYSALPLPEGCEPHRLISIVFLSISACTRSRSIMPGAHCFGISSNLHRRENHASIQSKFPALDRRAVTRRSARPPIRTLSICSDTRRTVSTVTSSLRRLVEAGCGRIDLFRCRRRIRPPSGQPLSIPRIKKPLEQFWPACGPVWDALNITSLLTDAWSLSTPSTPVS